MATILFGFLGFLIEHFFIWCFFWPGFALKKTAYCIFPKRRFFEYQGFWNKKISSKSMPNSEPVEEPSSHLPKFFLPLGSFAYTELGQLTEGRNPAIRGTIFIANVLDHRYTLIYTSIDYR